MVKSRIPGGSFVRYADDVVGHCRHKEEAEAVLKAIKERLGQVELNIKESKTRIVYCKDYRRKEKQEFVEFDFLGFSFQPISVESIRQEGTYFNGYGSKPSSTNIQKMIRSIRLEKAFRNTSIVIKDVAKRLNAKLGGWINYYGLFSKYHLSRVMYRVDYRLIKWVKKKHKVGLRKAIAKINAIKQDDPKLFYHWEAGICLKLQ